MEECLELLRKLEDLLDTASYKAEEEQAFETKEAIDEAWSKVKKFLRKYSRSEKPEDTIEGWF